MIRSLLSILFLASLMASASAASDDPYLWLEDVDGSAAMDWVHARNAVTKKALEGDADYATIEARLLAIYDSKDRIPDIATIGDHVYNFWRDATHVRGIMRRTTLAEYRKAEPAWDTIIDVDAIAKADGENWVWKGWQCRWPDFDRCFVQLSRGGGDATITREFDLKARRFVTPDEGGFALAEAKGNLSWIDRDHVFVRTDFGSGSMTTSGYPRIVKRWTRGTPLAEAVQVLAGEATDVSVSARRWHLRIGDRIVWKYTAERSVTFYTGEKYRIDGERLVRIDVPDDASIRFWRDRILVTLRSAWPAGTHGSQQDWPAGALLAIDDDRFAKGDRDFKMLFTPGPRRALAGVTGLRDRLLVHESVDVRNRVVAWTPKDDGWMSRPVDLPADGTVALQALDPDAGDQALVYLSSALSPTTLALLDVDTGTREPLKSLPAFFDATGMSVAQYEAKSADGTSIPYMVVTPKGFAVDGKAPTILYGYGGFEIPMLPRAYAAANGAGWLAQGGVFVVAGIRGGGEFGPTWHTAAIKANKQKSYDDFIAVAEDLVARKITSPAHLGIMGGSNGGLLVGAVAMQRPALFKAVVCQVPLLDMRRYHKLLAGASWMGEYGDPDVPEEWAWISGYSPYQKVAKDVRYPRFLFETSTRDDRVHPGHARKMAAKMLDQGHDVLYYENTEGGHAGAANNRQQARLNALAYRFMMRELR